MSSPFRIRRAQEDQECDQLHRAQNMATFDQSCQQPVGLNFFAFLNKNLDIDLSIKSSSRLASLLNSYWIIFFHYNQHFFAILDIYQQQLFYRKIFQILNFLFGKNLKYAKKIGPLQTTIWSSF